LENKLFIHTKTAQKLGNLPKKVVKMLKNSVKSAFFIYLHIKIELYPHFVLFCG